MKVNLFNHWFKYKVPVDDHLDRIRDRMLKSGYFRNLDFWSWANETHDVGQYYNWREQQNYMVFHNKEHYMMFLLKL